MAKVTQQKTAAAPAAPEAPAAPAKPKKAFTVERVEGGWRFVTLTYETEGGVDRVTSAERREPNLKSLALEQLKIALFNYWTKGVE